MKLAIDPGSAGGIAYLSHAGGTIVAENLPESDSDKLTRLRELYEQAEGTPELFLEKVAPHTNNPVLAASMAKLYGGAKFIEGVAMTLGYRIVMVAPKDWQKFFGLSKGKKKTGEWKNELKDEAARRHPELKVTLKTADAILILDSQIEKKRD